MDEAADMVAVIAGRRVISIASQLYRWWFAEAGSFRLMMPRVLIEHTQVSLGRVGDICCCYCCAQAVIIFLRSDDCCFLLLILLMLQLLMLDFSAISGCILLFTTTTSALSIVKCIDLERVLVIFSAVSQHYRLALFVKKFREVLTLLTLS